MLYVQEDKNKEKNIWKENLYLRETNENFVKKIKIAKLNLAVILCMCVFCGNVGTYTPRV